MKNAACKHFAVRLLVDFTIVDKRKVAINPIVVDSSISSQAISIGWQRSGGWNENCVLTEDKSGSIEFFATFWHLFS